MGRVYEALTKSEEEWKHTARTDSERSADDADSSRGDSDKEFDFVKYSLNTPSAAELQRSQADLASKARVRQNLARPARQAEVNVERIDPHLVAFYDCDPSADDEYNKLAALIIGNARAKEMKRLLIASARHGDGRTSVALNLASALGRANKRTLLLDTDLRRPSILRLLGIEADLGIVEALDRNLAPGAAAVRIVSHNFVVLPTRARVDSPAHVLASDAFGEMLTSLEPDYDFMIFDSPPLLDSKDSNLLFRLTNRALLVIRAGDTKAADLSKAVAPLSAEDIFGVVLNRAA